MTVEIGMGNNNQNIVKAVNQYGSQLLGFIRSKVNNNEDAEDLLQDVWYQLSKINDDIEKIESISGWLYRVAKNKITDRFRKRKTENIEDFTYENEEGEINFKEILLLDPHTPEQEYFKKIFWEELLKALDELPEKQRHVFIQNELEDISLQEIANQTGESIKTIISRKGYAVSYLRSKLNMLYRDYISH